MGPVGCTYGYYIWHGSTMHLVSVAARLAGDDTFRGIDLEKFLHNMFIFGQAIVQCLTQTMGVCTVGGRIFTTKSNPRYGATRFHSHT